MSIPSSVPTVVFGDLRPGAAAALDVPAVAELLEALLARGWRPRQLRDRVGALAMQPSVAEDARVVTDLLRSLLDQASPQEAYDDELARRARARQIARDEAPTPASPEDRATWVSAIRSGLRGGGRRVAFGPPVRLRPDCALCAGEGQFFVRRDVHLCATCVDLLAAGQVRPESATGS